MTVLLQPKMRRSELVKSIFAHDFAKNDILDHISLFTLVETFATVEMFAMLQQEKRKYFLNTV